jgi:tRNA pseudouridine55 synthase
VNGVLIIDKPAGMTSRQVDNRIRARVGRKVRVGHAGTLDPFATGVLPVMIGEATKLSRFLSADEKEYEAELVLGVKTDTGDCEGEPAAQAPVPCFTESDVRSVMETLTGTFLQQVPAYSAVKVEGRRLYDMARRGQVVELPRRSVTVHRWRLISLDGQTIVFRVACAAGTYVRALGEALAEGLGTLGHLRALRRLRVGSHGVDGAVSLDAALEELPLKPLESVLDMPVLPLDARARDDIGHGRPIAAGGATAGPAGVDLVQAHDEAGRLLALLTRTPRAEGDDVWRVLRGFRVGSG